jgi:protein MPE1
MFKFRSSKEPTRINFDGTAITVFELKREIINVARLGDGKDFDLSIFDEGSTDGMYMKNSHGTTFSIDSDVEYDDDTTLIPRSSMIVARRTPAARPGHGKAARYVSGRMPNSAKANPRSEKAAAAAAAATAAKLNNAMTEEERIDAILDAQGESWKQRQQEMAHAKPVAFKGARKFPGQENKPPPDKYVCFRCGQKGHWIQDCPTNDDPNWDKNKRFKRSTGIPKTMMQRVEDSDSEDENGRKRGYLLDADGNKVRVLTDIASWEKFEASHKAATAKKAAAEQNDKEVKELGLACPIDDKLMVAPTKTPCCSKTYCHSCIEDAIVNNDLVCPNCGTENVLIDDLLPDQEMALKIKAYNEEKEVEKDKVRAAEAAIDDQKLKEKREMEQKAEEEAKAKAEAAVAKAAAAEEERKRKFAEREQAKKDEAAKANGDEATPDEADKDNNKEKDDSKPEDAPSPAGSTSTANSKGSKKRKASADLDNDRATKGPTKEEPAVSEMEAKFKADMDKLAKGEFPMSAAMSFPPQAAMVAPNMAFPGISMGMGMPNAMAMNQMGWNPMMAQQMGWNPAMMNPMSNQQFSQQNGYGYNNNNSNWQNQNWQQQQQQQQPQQQWNNNNSMGGGHQGNFNNRGGYTQNFRGNYQNNNQQFNKQNTGEEDSPYLRQPVNPHRHNRPKRQRPGEYKELGG